MSDNSGPIEQYLHIAEMKAKLNELSDGNMVMETSEDVDQELQESFLESILAYERAEQVPFRTILERDALIFPKADELTDEELSAKLDEVIQAMAKRRNFLEWTNHLSDRELYTHLIEISFEETVPDIPDDPSNCHLDMSSVCNEEGIDSYLKFYADEDTRAHWAESFPDDVIPPHEDPPYDRDRHLPKPPHPSDIYEDPEIAAKWCAEQRSKLLAQLADAGITHGDIDSEPVSYAPPVAAVWAVESKDSKGTIEWWALNGEYPFVYASIKEISNPRDFLKAISKKWHAEADTQEESDRQAQEQKDDTNKPLIPLQPIYWKRIYAQVLEKWAEDDSAWDEEWRTE